MFCTINNKICTPVRTTDTQIPEYPKEYFEKNGKNKPPVRISQGGINLDTVREFVISGIEKDELNVLHAVRYMQLVCDKIKLELESDWTSFGVVIGNKGQKLSPLDLLQVKVEQDPTIEGKRVEEASERDDIWVMLILTTIYRLSLSSNASHRATLIEKLNNQVKGMKKNPPVFSDNLSLYNAFATNPDYVKLTAAIDMYFAKFKNSEWSVLRFGSVSTKFKDCASLLSMSHMCDIAGVKMEEFLDWVFVSSLGEEILRMMEPGNELDQPDSYMPYMMAMGLSRKSPYSSMVNPGIYTFVHLVGSLLGSQRSINARFFCEANVMNIKMNASVMAFVKYNKANMTKVFIKPEIKEQWIEHQSKDNFESNEADSDSEFSWSDMPQSSDPSEWYLYLESNSFELPDPIKEFVSKESKKFHSARVGSVGKFWNTNA
uniref:Nucleoprotein n=1 Tax=Mavingoni virus TaxID=2603829 RepID=A0A5B9BIG5_9RHAB|nr:nucleoprotein [Mavingoni virus]